MLRVSVFCFGFGHFHRTPFHTDQQTHLNTLTSDFSLQCEFVQVGFYSWVSLRRGSHGYFSTGETVGYDNNITRVDMTIFDPFIGQCYDATSATL